MDANFDLNKIIWKSEYNIGDLQIDKEHQNLFMLARKALSITAKHNDNKEKLVLKDDIDNLVLLYDECDEPLDIPYHLNFLLKYLKVDDSLLLIISKILYSKSKKNIEFLHGLPLSFNSYTLLNKSICNYFSSDIELLKNIYLSLDNYQNYFDYNSHTLNEILDIDYPIIMAPMFLVTNTKMMIEALNSDIAACVPALNYRTDQELRDAILQIRDQTNSSALGINLIVNKSNIKLKKQLQSCLDLEVDFIITSLGSPKDVIEQCKPKGIKVFCDVINRSQR